MSRDDSIVMALPSNILPENKKNWFYSTPVILRLKQCIVEGIVSALRPDFILFRIE